MLEILTSSRREAGPKMCDRMSRRAMLRIGALAPLGLSLPALLAAENRASAAAGVAGSSFLDPGERVVVCRHNQAARGLF